MSLTPIAADSGKTDRREYWRRYYLANRERKIAAAKAAYRRRVAAAKAAKQRARAPRFYGVRHG